MAFTRGAAARRTHTRGRRLLIMDATNAIRSLDLAIVWGQDRDTSVIKVRGEARTSVSFFWDRSCLPGPPSEFLMHITSTKLTTGGRSDPFPLASGI